MAVLEQLERHEDYLSLPQLMELLNHRYADRTVRRWLTSLIEEGLVEKKGKKRGTQYRAIVSTISEKSLEIIQYIQLPIYKRKPVTYNQKWFDSYRPNSTNYLSDSIKNELYQTGLRTPDEQPAGTYARRIYNRLLIDLSYNSSRLEGNTYSLLDTERLIFEGKSAKGKLDEEKIMILNHKEAIRHLVDSAHRLSIDTNEVCTLHFLLADGLVPTQYAGKIRDHGVRIGGSSYIPLENPILIQKQLTRICNIAAMIENPYEQSFFLLVHLAYLQAFTDVNKRTSRLCANIPFILNNLVPISFNNIGKDDYINALIVIYELNEIQPLLELYAESYLHSCQLYNVTVEAVGFDEIRIRYRQERREVVREIIINQMHGSVMRKFIKLQTNEKIKEEDHAQFVEDVLEDLKEIAPQRIVGLGITNEELNKWLADENK